MQRNLRAFISYRRQDTFLHRGVDEFITKLIASLKQAGFSDVFLDETGIKPGTNFEGRIYQAILDCDLFVAVIGKSWLPILQQRLGTGEKDILVREIRAALKMEKEILTLLVDDADMPPESALPSQISQFHYNNAVQLQSADTVGAISAQIKASTRQIFETRELGARWFWLYLVFACAAWVLCAVVPHVVGIWEFGPSWGGMAQVWSGLYIWPILFLPFVLMATYRPITILIERAAYTSRMRDRLTYLTPLVLGTVIALLAVFLDAVGVNEVPWSIYPALPGCHADSATAPPESSLRNFGIVTSYNAEPPGGFGPSHQSYENEFWAKNKCWPNVFYYLTVPVSQYATNEIYTRDRPAVRAAFDLVLADRTARYSKTFFAYTLSLAILMWIGCTGVVMSVFYVAVAIRRPDDDTVLNIPSEDAQLCLTYSFVNLMAWVPFRINTLYFKKLYLCDTLSACDLDPKFYLNDLVFCAMLLIGFVALSTGLLVNYKRRMLAVWGLLAVGMMLLAAFAVFRFGADLAHVTGSWQFYVAIAIPSIVIMLALWYQFDPSVVRFRDFKHQIE